MNQVRVDQPLAGLLEQLAGPVELVDASGRPLGRFLPLGVTASAEECPYSAEELAAMRAETGGRPLAEIWKSLAGR